MKEALGNTFLTTLAIVFLSLLMFLLIATLTYSKAYKAKNKIVSVIEKYDGFTDSAKEEVDIDLFSMGYSSSRKGKTCPDFGENSNLVHSAGYGSYDYCVYSVNTSRGIYYHVITYAHFDIPIAGEYINIAVEGDSRTVTQSLEG